MKPGCKNMTPVTFQGLSNRIPAQIPIMTTSATEHGMDHRDLAARVDGNVVTDQGIRDDRPHPMAGDPTRESFPI